MGKKNKNKRPVDMVGCQRCTMSGMLHQCYHTTPPLSIDGDGNSSQPKKTVAPPLRDGAASSSAAAVGGLSIEDRMKAMSDSFAEQLKQLQDDHRAEVADLRQQMQQKDTPPAAVSSGQQFSPTAGGHVMSPSVFSCQQPTYAPPPFPQGFTSGAAASSSTPRVSLPPLPSFSGKQQGEQLFSIWERDFAADMVAAGNQRHDWPRYFRRYLTGAALSAYYEISSSEPSVQYDDLVQKFRRRFDRVKTANECQRDVDRLYWPRNESIEDFGDRCLAVCQKAKRYLDPRLQEVSVQWECHNVFLRCMSPAIRHMLRNTIRNQIDPDAPVEITRLVKWVRRYMDDQDADVALEKERKVRNEVWQDKPKGPPNGGRAAAPFQPTLSAQAPSFSPPPQQQPSPMISPPANWDQMNNNSSPSPAAGLAVGHSPRVCFQCGDPTHMRSRCPQLQVQNGQNNIRSPGNAHVSAVNPASPAQQSFSPPRKRPKPADLPHSGRQEMTAAAASKGLPLPDASVMVAGKMCADLEARVDAAPLKERLSEKAPSFTARTMMFIPLKIESVEIDAQIDTGSPVVIINGDVLSILTGVYGREELNRRIKSVPRPFYDMQNKELPLSGMLDIDFELNGVIISCPAMINIKMSRPLLIGLSFFERIGLEMKIPTGNSAVRWVLSPEREVNGEPISIFFGRIRRRTLQERGDRRRQQKRDSRSQRQIVNLVRSVHSSHPTLTAGAVLTQPTSLDAKTAEFLRFYSMDKQHAGMTTSVCEFGLSQDADCSVPDQLVTVSPSGFFFAEVRNDSDVDVCLQPGDLILHLDRQFVIEKGVCLSETSPVSRCVRCRRRTDVSEDKSVALVVNTPPKLNLRNLRFNSLDERLQKIREKANVAGDNSDISAPQMAWLQHVLEKNHDVIALDDTELGECTLSHLAHKIDTGDHSPIALPCRRVPFGIRAGVDKTLNHMKENGVIRPSSSPWSSPIVPVRKPDGSIRITVDYRRLNSITKKDRYPLARCDDILDGIGVQRPEYFTTLDLVQGFHQQTMSAESVKKTAFSCPSGHFEYTRLPMGLCNSPSNFQRLQDELLRGVDKDKVKVYLDDVAIATTTFEEHIEQLQIVFDRFRGAGMRVKLSKCQFLRKEVVFLGFLIDKTGLRPNPKRIQGIVDLTAPENVKDVRRFIGCCSYYRRFVKGFAKIARPLTNLLHKDVKWTWSDEEQKAFETLKEALVSPPVLHYPHFGKPFFIVCDASAQGLGAILHQKDENGKHVPVAYASRATHRTEQSYSATDLEGLCLTWALLNYHHYIWGHDITVEVDHQPLVCLNSKLKLPPRLERWNAIISSYGAKIVYRKGTDNEPADMLSRFQQVAGSASEPAVDESDIIGLISTQLPTDDDVFPTDADVQRELQLQDSLLCRLMQFLEHPLTFPETERADLKKATSCYSLLNGVLYFRRNCDVSARICVPLSERNTLVESYHRGKNSGAHFASDKTYRKLALKFFWPSMKGDVFKFCKRCLACAQEHGVERRRRPPLHSVTIPSEPFAKIGIDVIKFPKTKAGNDRALGIVDYFSGYLIYVAIPDETAETIAKVLVERVFNVFGSPQTIISDQGVNFTSVVQKELEVIFRVQHRFTTTFNPRSNGKIERANRTMKAILTRMTTDYPEDWDQLLSHATFAYNATPQDSTGYAPHFLVFGRLPQPVNDSIFDRQTLGHKLDLTDYISELERQMSITYAVVQEQLGRSQLRQKEGYDKTAAVSKIAVGDSVMLFRPDLKSNKLHNSYDGPYKVVWMKTNTAGLQRLNGGVIEIHNLEKLSKCPADLFVSNQSGRRLRTHFRHRKGATPAKGGGGRTYNLRNNPTNVISLVMSTHDDSMDLSLGSEGEEERAFLEAEIGNGGGRSVVPSKPTPSTGPPSALISSPPVSPRPKKVKSVVIVVENKVPPKEAPPHRSSSHRRSKKQKRVPSPPRPAIPTGQMRSLEEVWSSLPTGLGQCQPPPPVRSESWRDLSVRQAAEIVGQSAPPSAAASSTWVSECWRRPVSDLVKQAKVPSAQLPIGLALPHDGDGRCLAKDVDYRRPPL